MAANTAPRTSHSGRAQPLTRSHRRWKEEVKRPVSDQVQEQSATRTPGDAEVLGALGESWRLRKRPLCGERCQCACSAGLAEPCLVNRASPRLYSVVFFFCTWRAGLILVHPHNSPGTGVSEAETQQVPFKSEPSPFTPVFRQLRTVARGSFTLQP